MHLYLAHLANRLLEISKEDRAAHLITRALRQHVWQKKCGACSPACLDARDSFTNMQRVPLAHCREVLCKMCPHKHIGNVTLLLQAGTSNAQPVDVRPARHACASVRGQFWVETELGSGWIGQLPQHGG